MFSKYKKVMVAVLITAGAFASITLASQSNAAVQNSPDCSNNSVIKCGAMTQDSLRAKYAASSELKALYGHFGISSAMINGPLYTGQVNKDGTIVYNGKTVATNAQSVGRYQDNGTGCKGSPFTVSGHTYYTGSTNCRFGYSSEVAYVMLSKSGQFLGAIVKGCGNPIPATPVKPPAPKPTYTCNAITAKQISRTEYEFNANTSVANGATHAGYSYNFGDGSTGSVGAQGGAVQHTYAKPGTYKVVLTAIFNASGKTVSDTNAHCQTTVTVAPAPVTPPVVKPAEVSCSALTADKVSDDTYNLKASATATPGIPSKQAAGSVSSYTYTVKDANGNVVKTINKDAGVRFLTNESGNITLQPGKYTAQVVVHSNVGDKTGTNCTVCITVPAPVQVKVCRLSDYNIVTINEKDFDSSKYTKDLTQCADVKVCDTTTGSIVTVKKGQVDNSRYTTDLTKCQVQVCDTTTNTVVTVTKDQAKDSKYTTDLSQCTNVQVCDTTTNQIVTVSKHEAENNDKYTNDLTKCQKVEVCDTTTGNKVEVYPSQIDNDHYTTDMTKCTPVVTPPAPQTPPELPHTGASDVIMSLVGAGSLIAAVSYYVASRRALG